MCVAHDLHFYVAGTLHQLFEIEFPGPESEFRLGPANPECLFQLCQGPGRAHAPASPACNGLDHYRRLRPEGSEECLGFLQRDSSLCSLRDRHITFSGNLPGFALVPENAQGVKIGANKVDTGLCTIHGKAAILTEKSIAGMNGIAPLLCRDGEDVATIQISRRSRPAQGHRCVASPCMSRRGIVPGINGDAWHTQFSRSACNTHSDFSPVGDQDFLEHVCLLKPRMNRLPRHPQGGAICPRFNAIALHRPRLERAGARHCPGILIRQVPAPDFKRP